MVEKVVVGGAWLGSGRAGLMLRKIQVLDASRPEMSKEPAKMTQILHLHSNAVTKLNMLARVDQQHRKLGTSMSTQTV